MTVYKSIYSKLQKIGILDASDKMPNMYMKFKCDGLMDLNVDRLSENMIALAHNGIQNGDVMADPDVQVIIYSGTKSATGIAFQNDYLGIYQDASENERLKREISVFLDDWLSNIINCEYILAETED